MPTRASPDAPPQTALTSTETELLDRLVPDKKTALEGDRHLAHYMIKIARRGGHLARKHDAPPGRLVMWGGLSRLTDIKIGAALGTGTAFA